MIIDRIKASVDSFIYFRIKCLNKYVIIGLLGLSAVCIVVFLTFFSLTSSLMEIGEKVQPALNITELDIWKDDSVFKYNAVYKYKNNGLDIKISVKKDSSTAALKRTIEMLDNAPEKLLAKCTGIIISPKKLKEAQGVPKETFAYTKSSMMCFYDAYLFEEVFYHEAGHLYDLNSGYPSVKEDFQKLYRSADFAKVKRLSVAKCDDCLEAWAVAVSAYFKVPQTLRQVYPEVYDHFDDIFGQKNSSRQIICPEPM